MNSRPRILHCLLPMGLLLCSLIPSSQQLDDPLAPHPNVAPAIKRIDAVVEAGPFAPTWESLADYEIPQWYKDAKFGIFIHWGVYSVPAYGSEWYPRQMYIENERRRANFFEHHNQTYGPQSEFGYKDFIPMFKAEKFDPEQWAELFEQAGAKYVVPVAEHHDGFPMYDCGFTEWDATEMGPKRDIIAELSKSIAAVRQVPGVRGLAVTSTAMGGTSVMSVSFGGEISGLAAALRERGFTVREGANALAISR